MSPTMPLLSLSTMEKDKDVASSLIPVAVPINLMSSAHQALEDALIVVLEVVIAKVIPRLMDSDISTQTKTTIARTLMLKIILDFPIYKFMEEASEVNVSLVRSAALVHLVQLPVFVSSILVLVLDPALNSK